jgi:hypothetical protein
VSHRRNCLVLWRRPNQAIWFALTTARNTVRLVAGRAEGCLRTPVCTPHVRRWTHSINVLPGSCRMNWYARYDQSPAHKTAAKLVNGHPRAKGVEVRSNNLCQSDRCGPCSSVCARACVNCSENARTSSVICRAD